MCEALPCQKGCQKLCIHAHPKGLLEEALSYLPYFPELRFLNNEDKGHLKSLGIYNFIWQGTHSGIKKKICHWKLMNFVLHIKNNQWVVIRRIQRLYENPVDRVPQSVSSICHFWCGYLGFLLIKEGKESPVQVRCMILDAWGWCTGTTQRDGMGREEGGGFRMGNTCIPVADSFQYLAKPIQYCKV